MEDLKLKQLTQDILDIAGIKINGKNDWDIIVHDNRFYRKALAQGSLGLIETYMDEWWDCKRLDEFFYRVLKADIDKKVKKKGILKHVLKAKLLNLQSKSRAYNIGEKHYDIGNDLYKNMLDKRMNYSCGYWKNSKTLDKAQEAKLDLICKKMGLKSGMKVLEIGCGWGGFLKFAAEKYKVKAVGITVSKKQTKLAKEICKGLPIEIRLQDYRKLNEKFDRVISIGMFEHVGPKNYKVYMGVAHRCLKPDGLFLLHTIGRNFSVKAIDRWVNKYIFPSAVLPSAKQIIEVSEELFVLEDWHNFGIDYDKTLMAWHKNFQNNWDKIKGNYSKRFKRMWEFYLLTCAGSFRSERNRLWQIVFSKGNIGEYRSVR